MSNPKYYPNRDMMWSGFPTNWSLLKRLMWVRIATGGGISPEYETVTGNPVTFRTVRPAPLRQLSVAFSPVQEGSGDPSPDNVRPISGWDSLTVEQTGKNLLNNVDPVVLNAYITGANKLGASAVDRIVLVPVKKNTTYTWTRVRDGLITENADDTNVLLFDTYPVIGETVGTSTGTNINVTPGVRTFDTGDNIYAAIKIVNTNKTNFDKTMAASQLEFGNQSTTHEPYNPLFTTISITIGQTVYSGTVDVISGVGEVTMASVDLGTLDWPLSTPETHVFRTDALKTVIKAPAGLTDYANAICSSFWQKLYQPLAASDNGAFAIAPNAYSDAVGRLVIIDHRYSTVEDFKAGNQGVRLVYELAEPLNIQLTPQEVESLAGDNVLFSDANGDLTVEYRSN